MWWYDVGYDLKYDLKYDFRYDISMVRGVKWSEVWFEEQLKYDWSARTNLDKWKLIMSEVQGFLFELIPDGCKYNYYLFLIRITSTNHLSVVWLLVYFPSFGKSNDLLLPPSFVIHSPSKLPHTFKSFQYLYINLFVPESITSINLQFTIYNLHSTSLHLSWSSIHQRKSLFQATPLPSNYLSYLIPSIPTLSLSLDSYREISYQLHFYYIK